MISVDTPSPTSEAEVDDESSRLPRSVRWAVAAVCAVYVALILVLLFQPDTGVPADGSNLVPFRSLRLQLRNGFTRQLVGNTLLLAPLGFTLRIWGVRLRTIALAMVAISVGIEVAQVLVDRVSDIDDVVLNTIGGVLGGALGGVVARILTRRS